MKTVQQWFDEAPQAFRDMFGRPKKRSTIEVPSLAEALNKGFLWAIDLPHLQILFVRGAYIGLGGEDLDFREEVKRAPKFLEGLEWAKSVLSTPSSEGGESKQQTKTPMHKYSAVPVARPTLVFGTDVSDLGANACIETIKSNNAQIKSLEETGIGGPYVSQQIAGLKAANEALVAQLNTFAAPAATPVEG